MTIATTILSQIGNKAIAMMGAKDFGDTGSGLRFKVRGSRKVNLVIVTLDPNDTYTVEFKKYSPRTFKCKDVSDFSGVYADNLHAILEAGTGLYTSL